MIGDLHGCDRLLDKMLARLPDPDQMPLVFVGDYIDRGENSKAVLERLFDLSRRHPGQVICLKGNHEDMALKFLDDPEERGPRWLRHGGLQTLASYGIGGITENSGGMELFEAASDLRQAMGAELVDWLGDLPLIWQSGNIAVTHAGADPALPLDRQDPRSLMWGHRDFARLPREDGQWVAHGHVILPKPLAVAGRIALDTGAYATGRLSAMIARPEGLEEISVTMAG